MVCIDCGRTATNNQNICTSCKGTVIITTSLKKLWENKEGEDFGKYLLIQKIARTASSTVYEAIDKQLGRTIALKILEEAHDNPERFKREAMISAGLNHTNICHIYEVAEHDGKLYIAMQYIDGSTIDCKKGRIREAVECIKQAAHSLDYAHKQGVVHRDIKPQNIMVDKQGRVFITDFGIAKVKGLNTLTKEDVVLGTPVYMSPEQTAISSRELDYLTDIYSLGATLYYLVTEKEPFKEKEVHKLFKMIQEDDPIPPSKINNRVLRELDCVIMKAMEKDKSSRYQTALEMAEDLQRFLDNEPVLAKPTPVPIRLIRRFFRKPLTWVPTIAAVVLLIILSFIIMTPSTGLSDIEVDAQFRINEAERMTFSTNWDYNRFKGLLDSVISDIEKSGAKTPTSKYLIGECYRLKGKYELSIRHYDEAIKRMPKFSAVYYSRGRAYLQWYISMQTFKQSSLKFFDPSELNTKKEMALSDFKNAKELATSTDLEFVNVLSMYMNNQLNEAKKSIENLANSDKDPRFLTILAFILQESKDEKRSVENFKNALDISPNYVPARIGLGIAYLNKKQFDDSIKEFENAIKITPEDPVLYLQLAYVRILKDDLDKATIDLIKTLELDNDLYLARVLLAGIYINTGKKDLAEGEIKHIRASIDKTKKNKEKAYLLALLGWFYLHVKDKKNADICFKEARDIDPELPEVKSAYIWTKITSLDFPAIFNYLKDLSTGNLPNFVFPFKRGLIYESTPNK